MVTTTLHKPNNTDGVQHFSLALKRCTILQLGLLRFFFEVPNTYSGKKIAYREGSVEMSHFFYYGGETKKSASSCFFK
jgi:hypothetical protein